MKVMVDGKGQVDGKPEKGVQDFRKRRLIYAKPK